MKKVLAVAAIAIVLLSLAALIVGASVEEIDFGSQSITLGSKYAAIIVPSGETTILLTFRTSVQDLIHNSHDY